MHENRPKLKDNKKAKIYEKYSLGNVPEEVILNIAKWIVYNYAVGKHDIDGEDWGDIFAKALDGIHLDSPVGLADVIYEGMAWSVKSVKSNKPHEMKTARIISGRCSPDYSYGITDPHQDIQKTGAAVLNIWNERVNIAKEKYEPLRSSLLLRNPNSLEFTLFESEINRFNINDYYWVSNKNGNLEGYYKDNPEKHKFTWQPHGSQFTIIYDIPSSSIRFKVKRPPVFDFQETIEKIGFNESWLSILK